MVDKSFGSSLMQQAKTKEIWGFIKKQKTVVLVQKHGT